MDWQNQRRAVPKMKATPAGIPIMTGQGRLGEDAVGTTLFWGFRSAKETRKLTTVNMSVLRFEEHAVS